MKFHCSYHRIFSLIELLLIITVIAILTSLMLPALKKAKERTYSTQCKSNIRQCGLGVINYANDFNGWVVPPNVNDAGTIVDDYMRTLASLMMRLGYSPRQGVMGYDWNVWRLPWPNIYACPSWPVPSAGYKWGSSVRHVPLTVYAYGVRVLYSAAYYPGERLDSKKRLVRINTVYSKCPFIVDDIGDWTGEEGVVSPGQYYQWSLTVWGTSKPHLRHNRQANVWLVDGSLQGWKASDFNEVKQPASGSFATISLGYRYE